jgi:nucleoside-diphosphate-sugar epimerase
MRVLVAGCGELGAALAARLAAAGDSVVGLRRRPEAAALAAGVAAFAADLADEASLRALPRGFDAVVYTAAPDARSEAAYRAVYVDGVANAIAAVPCARFLLASSTSVYGQDAGEWVDETSETSPREPTGRLVLEGERIALSHHPGACAVRFGGIYGPGRTRLLDAAREGELAVREGAPRYTNRIHRDDAAGVIEHLVRLPRLERVYVAVDCEPAADESVYRWLAARAGGAEPRRVPLGAGGGGAGKRCSNRRLLASGYRFLYPTFREGYGALIEGERR